MDKGLVILNSIPDIYLMVSYTTTILKFDEMGEKTGWTYIEVPAEYAEKLKPGNKKSFRVKGKLDDFAIKGIALMPMGGGDFIMPLNADIRKGIGKRKGAKLSVKLEADDSPITLSGDLLDCLADEPKALEFFNQLTLGHRKYFSNWIESAKTEPTKAKRIAMAVNAMARGLHYGLMIREQKANK
jgi:hypothetical protein